MFNRLHKFKRPMPMMSVALVALVPFAASSCGSTSTQKLQRKIVQQDVRDINEQLAELRKNEPLPKFHDSAALHVQDAYYTADADPNKLWYVTMVANDGTPYAHYTTRGAPQPAGDEVTNPVQIACPRVGSSGDRHCDVIGLPEPNGVHQGTSNEGYVAISTTGAILRFPSQGAHISDQPFNIDTPVKLSINENAAISKTDTSKSTNGIVPTGSGQRQK